MGAKGGVACLNHQIMQEMKSCDIVVECCRQLYGMLLWGAGCLINFGSDLFAYKRASTIRKLFKFVQKQLMIVGDEGGQMRSAFSLILLMIYHFLNEMILVIQDE